MEVGGTITGEHGVVMEKIDQMCVQFPEPELRQFHAVKAVFDPKALLNPGKAVPTLHRCADSERGTKRCSKTAGLVLAGFGAVFGFHDQPSGQTGADYDSGQDYGGGGQTDRAAGHDVKGRVHFVNLISCMVRMQTVWPVARRAH